MNEPKIFDIAKIKTPNVQTNNLDGWLRHEIVNHLEGNENIGIELGVAKGVYSKRMIESQKFKRFYGVDVYGDAHDTVEYRNTIKFIGVEEEKYALLRMDFTNALELFPDNYFDFIYVDGYAHTGEEGGKTFIEWYRKLKVGGIMAGDDYHDDWPLVKWAVNDFALQSEETLNITTGEEQSEYCKYPTWFIKKTKHVLGLKTNKELYTLAMQEKERIRQLRAPKPQAPVQNPVPVQQPKAPVKSHFFPKTVIPQGLKIQYEEPVFMDGCFVFCHTKIGAYTYFGDTHIGSLKSIGRFCSIAPGVKIGLGEHTKNYLSTHPLFFKSAGMFNFTGEMDKFKETGVPRTLEIIKEEPIIGNDVWIGANAIIARGVTIGDGAIIGANSLVLQDVPPYAIVGGSPAKIIKYRFEPEIIAKLLELQWWNYSPEIFKNKPVDNIESIINYLETELKNAQPIKYQQWEFLNDNLRKI